MMRLLSSLRLMNLSPLFVKSPTPCFLVTLSLFLSLLHPTVAVRSPSMSKSSCRETSSTVTVNCQLSLAVTSRWLDCSCSFYGLHVQVFAMKKCSHIPKFNPRPSHRRQEICHRAGDVLTALVPRRHKAIGMVCFTPSAR